MKVHRKLTILVFLLTYLYETHSTLSPKNKGGKKKQEVKIEQKLPKPRLGPQKYSVFDKNFVSEDVTSKDILANYQAFYAETDDYNFDGLVLGYVTPWNNHGYDVAKIFGNKFTHICPVWLQIKRRGSRSYEVTGTHDIDKQWVVDVRNAGRERKTKVVPRVLFDGWSGQDYTTLINSDDEVKSMMEVLVKSCKQYKFEGYVFELWTYISGAFKPEVLVRLVRTMSDSFAAENLDFILVIPPKRGKNELFTGEQFDALYDHVTAFSVMTYDYSSPKMPGPNAPYGWVEETITSLTSNHSRRPKILLGLNFYGNEYTTEGGGSIVAHEYVDRLKRIPEKALTYNAEVAEHYFEYLDDEGVKHLVFYPTLYYIFKRLNLANQLHTGVCIWEIGQGLDYFYDLL